MRVDRTKQELAEDLIYYRGLGYTQQQIAEKLDHPQPTISRWYKKIRELHESGELDVAIGVELK